MRAQISSVDQAPNWSGISLTWRQSRETHLPEDGERRQLLKIKWEVKAEPGLEESSDGLWGGGEVSFHSFTQMFMYYAKL